MVTGLVQSQADDGFVPPMIVVAITWGGSNPNFDDLRFKDLTPTHSERFPQSGNGPKFLAFLKKELIPFIESQSTAGARGVSQWATLAVSLSRDVETIC